MPKRMNHGDFRQFVTMDLWKKIEEIFNQKSARRRPYYILVIVKPHYQGPPAVSRIEDGAAVQANTADKVIGGHVCHTRLVLMEQAPPVPQLGTILFKVDNRKGYMTLVYALPQDKPNLTADSDNEGAVAVLAAESAKNLRVPLFYS